MHRRTCARSGGGGRAGGEARRWEGKSGEARAVRGGDAMQRLEDGRVGAGSALRDVLHLLERHAARRDFCDCAGLQPVDELAEELAGLEPAVQAVLLRLEVACRLGRRHVEHGGHPRARFEGRLQLVARLARSLPHHGRGRSRARLLRGRARRSRGAAGAAAAWREGTAGRQRAVLLSARWRWSDRRGACRRRASRRRRARRRLRRQRVDGAGGGEHRGRCGWRCGWRRGWQRGWRRGGRREGAVVIWVELLLRAAEGLAVGGHRLGRRWQCAVVGGGRRLCEERRQEAGDQIGASCRLRR